MNLEPLHDRLLVRRHEADEKTSGGVLLPDSAQDKPQKGTVEKVGPGKVLKDGKHQAMQVKEGDVVLFTTWAGDEFKRGGEDVILVMKEEDILAVLE